MHARVNTRTHSHSPEELVAVSQVKCLVSQEINKPSICKPRLRVILLRAFATTFPPPHYQIAHPHTVDIQFEQRCVVRKKKLSL